VRHKIKASLGYIVRLSPKKKKIGFFYIFLSNYILKNPVSVYACSIGHGGQATYQGIKTHV
jgi:hypothetical protein